MTCRPAEEETQVTRRSGETERTVRVFRTGELLLKAVEAEAVMDALAQDAAGLLFPLHDEDGFRALLQGGDGGCHAGGAGSDDKDVRKALSHGIFLPSGILRRCRTAGNCLRRSW